MTIKAILFDADGVSLKEGKPFSIRYQEEYNISSEEMQEFFTKEFPKAIIGQADLKDLLEPWLQKWKWTGTVDELLEWWFSAERTIDEEVLAYVSKLREQGIQCYLGTNQEARRAEYLAKEVGLEQHFDALYISAHLGVKKPNKEFFEEIMRRENLKPQEVMFFDDDEKNVQGAKDAGIQRAYLYKTIKDLENATEDLLK